VADSKFSDRYAWSPRQRGTTNPQGAPRRVGSAHYDIL